MASKAKVASLAVPLTREEFHQYLAEMRGIAGTVEGIQNDRDATVARLDQEKREARESAAKLFKAHEERFRLLFAAVSRYFKKHRGELLEGDKKSYETAHAIIGARLVGPSIRFKAKVGEIVDAVLDLGWGKRFLTLKPSKQKFRADLERARQVPGVEVMEQRDELFVQFPGTLRVAVGGKLKKKGEEEEDEAA